MPTPPEALRAVEADGIRWRVRVDERPGAPCWLLLHGTGASSHSWRAVADRLAPHASVVVPDLPGQGGSTLARRSQLTLPGMAAALMALWRALGTGRDSPEFIAGHSAGAALAVQMALEGLARPRAIVAVGGAFLPFGGVAAPLFTPLARALYAQRWVPRLFSRRAADPAVVRRLIEGTGSTLDADGVAEYQRLMLQPAHTEATLGMMAHWDLRALARRLPSLAVPLELVVGQRDRAVPPRQAQRVAARCAQAHVTRLPHAGHLAHEEDPAAVACILQDLTVRLGRGEGARL